ncbi:MAG TPA: SpoIIE family protein phosphatase [Phycisphaerae bacterium]|nr:SpoIIE family protein phosphatase [Phycisphaerae bacterium]
MPELAITTSDGMTRRRTLTGPVVLGRDPSCEVSFDDPGTSRRHACIRPEGKGYVVEDLGSKNGTLVNDVTCTTVRLRDGDEIMLGSVRVLFRDESRADDTSTSVILSDDSPPRESTTYSRQDSKLLLPQQRLQMLYDLSERLTRLRDREGLLEDALNIGFETLQFERGAVAIRKPGGRGVEWPVVRNLQSAGGELKISNSVLGRALNHGERAVINDTAFGDADPTISMVQHGIRSALCVPLQHRDEILGVIYGDRVTTGTVYSTADVDFLAGLAKLVSIGLINARLVSEQEAKVALEHEISLARDIQQRLFPEKLPDRADVKVAVLNEPGRRVSGDYYDVFELDEGRIAFVVADVTGEGVAASLLMANLQAAVRVTLSGREEPGALLGVWNRLIYRNTEPSKFVTCLLAIVDPVTHRVTLANAGHHQPYVIRRGGECGELQAEAGYPLGVVDHVEYATGSIELGPAPCTLFCYTDGVIEAMNDAGEIFTFERMVEVLHGLEDSDPGKTISRVREAVHAFCGGAAQSDDITMLAVEMR